MLRIVKPLRSGQITLPVAIRKKLKFDEDTLLQLRLVGKEIRLTPTKISRITTDSSWARELYDLFADARKEAGKYSTKEIDRDIQNAVGEVRKKK